MDTIIVFSYISNTFLFIPKAEWEEEKDSGDIVFIKNVTYTLNIEVETCLAIMNQQIKSIK